ncbi:MAG TPA: cation diffusion facilitator family transporter [Candidatus Omnitrophota bacterium]|nr:cation diffusion facilitator family transporter [Candidatus Omnitrophota bacterium]
MNSRNGLIVSIVITAAFFLVELIGGYFSHSLALMSDAGHMVTDALALALALAAYLFSLRPATKEKTFGYYRFEIISALFNGSFLVAISLLIFYSALKRFLHPVEVQTGLMLAIAVIGLFANAVPAFILYRKPGESLNLRGAYLHLLADTASSIAVIVGGIVIYFTGFYLLDPILGIVIGLLILKGALDLVYRSVNILLESAPEGIDTEQVAASIKSINGVKSIHDLHVWTITSGINAISAHLLLDDAEAEHAPEILHEINGMLKEKYNISHSTFQTECESCPDGLICKLDRGKEREQHGHHH